MAMKKYTSVDQFFEEQTTWHAELARLREIVVTMGMEETLKWSAACYVHQGKNVVGMLGFKSYFGLWFHQGALLEDPQQVLINAQQGKTKALRQWRMSSKSDIKVRVIKSYLREAIALVESGQEIKPSKPSSKVVLPPQLQQMLAQKPRVATKFAEFTPGKQREFCNYIEQAKRAETKRNRLEKIVPMILDGISMNDKYRK